MRYDELSVPFSKSRLRIALVQLAGPHGAKQPIFLHGRETFAWTSQEEVALRRHKAQRVLATLRDQHPGTDLLVFPEYSLPLDEVLDDLQDFATQENVVVIGGSDSFRTSQGRIYNQCPVLIPTHEAPIWIRKRDLSQWELNRVDEAKVRRRPLFVWTHEGVAYWFAVYICLDFRGAIAEPLNADKRPGFFVVPMCSPDVSMMRTFADTLLRADAGRASVLCNAADEFSIGNSCLMAVTPTGRLLEPAIELPRTGEFLLVFDLDCSRLVPPRKTPARPISPLVGAWTLSRIVPSPVGFDFRPEGAGTPTPSIGIVNPEIFQVRGGRMRMAFLQVPNYAEVADRNAAQHFEILAVLGQDDIVVSHVAPTEYDFKFDLKQVAPQPAATFEAAPADANGNDPFFEVDTYFKVLGRTVTPEDRRVFRQGQLEPTDEELNAVFALAENWDSSEIGAETRRDFIAKRWILGDTRRVPGNISAIMAITLDHAGPRDHGVFDLFESQILPEIVNRSEVTSVYGGSGRRVRIDYVLRLSATLEELYPLISFVHQLASDHRVLITTTTYVVVHKISSLDLRAGCRGVDAAEARGHFLYYHLWNRLESLERRRFQDMLQRSNVESFVYSSA